MEHARHHGATKFFVDGEEYKTRQHEYTPNAIIAEFGGLAPASHYLVKIAGGAKESFQGKGDVSIRIHEGERFQIISVGPTPVADAVPLVW